MKMSITLALCAAVTVLSACSTVQTQKLQDSEERLELSASIQDDEGNVRYTFTRKETLLAAELRFSSGDSIVIESDRNEHLRMEVSKDAWGRSGYSDKTRLLQEYLYSGTKYKISYDMLFKLLGKYSGGLKHNQIIRISDEESGLVIMVRCMSRWTPSGLTVPILYKLDGSFQDFTANPFLPSLAWGVRLNLDWNYLSHLSALMIVSIEQREDNGNNSAILGTALDLGGWIQLGVVFNPALEWEASLIIGMTPTSILENLL